MPHYLIAIWVVMEKPLHLFFFPYLFMPPVPHMTVLCMTGASGKVSGSLTETLFQFPSIQLNILLNLLFIRIS